MSQNMNGNGIPLGNGSPRNMNGHDILLDEAELLSTILEGILYGFSLLMFGETIRQLFSQRRIRRVNYKMVVVACLLLLCSTVHLVIAIIRIMKGLISHTHSDTGAQQGGPITFFSSVSQWTFVSKNCVYVIQTLIGDGVIIYRCYAVWRSKLVMILPVCLWISVAVTGVQSVYVASQLTPENSVFSENISGWMKTFYATAFVTNVLTTYLLAYRIWYLDREATKLRGHFQSQMGEILRTIIDSGVIYSLALLALMVCYSHQTNGQYVILDMMVPLISITFYVVIIRVGAFCNRTNQPLARNAAPQGHTSTVDSLYADTGVRMQARATALLEDVKVDNGPMSAANGDRDGNNDDDRYHSDITDINGSREAV